MSFSTFVINLDRDVDRLAYMRDQLGRTGIAFERMAAVKGAELREDLKPFFDAVTTLSAGEIGCYGSHLVLMQRLARREIVGPMLVLEDDVELPADFPDLIEALLTTLPAGWDIVRLTSTPKRAFANLAALPGGRHLVRYSLPPGSTGAYLLSAAGAGKFLKPMRRELPIDQDLKRLWLWGLDTYGVWPTPVRADIFETSSIDAMAPKDHRKNRARLNRMRRARMGDTWTRNAWNVRQFGLRRWLGLAAINAKIMLTPKRARNAALERGARWLQL